MPARRKPSDPCRLRPKQPPNPRCVSPRWYARASGPQPLYPRPTSPIFHGCASSPHKVSDLISRCGPPTYQLQRLPWWRHRMRELLREPIVPPTARVSQLKRTSARQGICPESRAPGPPSVFQCARRAPPPCQSAGTFRNGSCLLFPGLHIEPDQKSARIPLPWPSAPLPEEPASHAWPLRATPDRPIACRTLAIFHLRR
mmetsp:Transcript_11263/g.28240  ORF Transcript_11263/g.28240 Transcript_11263/m.28240 type:complete len:200 (-) Transcript_11263:74-673(-)